jgi:hypothetical protein
MGISAVAGCSSVQDSESFAEQDSSTTEQSTDSRYAQFPPYIITNRRNISVTYKTLDGDIKSWQWDSSVLTAQNTAGNFAREMTYSQLEYLGWDDFGFEGRSKYQELGDFGVYYQLNPFTVPSNFSPLSEAIYDRYETDLERIRAAWNFVTQVNEYVSEIEETPRFPLETLLMGGGDCEDSVILLGSILYSMPTDLETTFVFMDIDNPTNPQDINHVALSAELEDSSIIIETTSPDNMFPYDQVEGFFVELESNGYFSQ